jgi:hypothetical protein
MASNAKETIYLLILSGRLNSLIGNRAAKYFSEHPLGLHLQTLTLEKERLLDDMLLAVNVQQVSRLHHFQRMMAPTRNQAASRRCSCRNISISPSSNRSLGLVVNRQPHFFPTYMTIMPFNRTSQCMEEACLNMITEPL